MLKTADVVFLPELLSGANRNSELYPKGFSARQAVVVVIDVIRASTTIITALENGAEAVLPVRDVDEARESAADLKSRAVLGGERQGLPPEGFDLGNSPLEYRQADLEGRVVVLTTTNGTRALDSVRDCGMVLIGAFTNAHAVAEYVKAKDKNFKHLLLLCAGCENTFSLEDTCCAGLIVKHLAEMHPYDLELSDAAAASAALYNVYHEKLLDMMRSARGGKKLIAKELGEDIAAAAVVAESGVVPKLVNDRLILDTCS